MRQIMPVAHIATLFLLMIALYNPPLTYGESGGEYYKKLSRGITQLKQNELGNASQRFKDALVEDPEGIEAHYYLGVTHARANRTKNAEEHFLKALSLDRTFLPAHFDLGVLYYQIGADDKAMATFKIVERFDPNRARVHYYQAIILRRNGKEAEAAAKMKRAVLLDPDLAVETHFQEGTSHYQSGELDSARDAFQSVVTLSPDGAMAETAKSFLSQIDAISEVKKRWNLSASLGIQYDDNVVLAPQGTSPNQASIQEKSDMVGVVYLHGKYRWINKDRWIGDVSYSFFQNLHREKSLDDFNIQDHHLTLSSGYRMDSKTISLTYELQTASLGGDAFLLRQAISPLLKIRHSKQHFTEVKYTFGDNDFKSSAPLFLPNDDRDVQTHLAEGTHYTFWGDRGMFYGALAFEKEEAGESSTEDDWSFSGHRLKAGLVFPIQKSITLSLEAQGEFRRFSNEHTLSPGKKRKDDNLLLILMASKALYEHFDLSVQYLSQMNNSNISVFEYRRNITGLIVTAKY